MKVFYKLIDQTDGSLGETMCETTDQQELIDAFVFLMNDWLKAGYNPVLKVLTSFVEEDT